MELEMRKALTFGVRERPTTLALGLEQVTKNFESKIETSRDLKP
jgi:hypothetical protein